MSEQQSFHSRRVEDVATAFDVDIQKGLSKKEVRDRAQRYGPNIIEERAAKGFLYKFFHQFANVMIMVLLAAAALAGVMGELTDAIVILIIVILNALIGSIQEYRAERALSALRKMTAPKARVRRNGALHNIPARKIVPGDVISLEAGDIVPADLRLCESVDLEIEEAALTGESLAVAKCTDVIREPDIPLGDRCNMAYKGTHVTRGHAFGITIATGAETELGRIATLLQESKEVLTPLQERLARFAKRLAAAVMLIAGILFTVGLLRGEEIFLMLLTAVSLAVAAIPEALPAVVVIALAMGAQKLSKKHALMRRLSAVETLGSVTYICSDKTGTLTLNEMRVGIVHADGKIQSHIAELPKDSDLQRHLGRALALCSNVDKDAQQRPTGDPTEVALFLEARDAGFNKDELESALARVAEIPFDAQRRLMSTLHQEDDGITVYVKGAPEAVLPLCSQQCLTSGSATMDAEHLLQQSNDLAEQGYRMLAIAMRTLKEASDDLSPEAVESDLTLLGLVGLMDPPRPGVEASIEDCRMAGITPVMITGDHPGTALAMADRLGIATHNGVMTGVELDELSDEAFAGRVKGVHVYARVSPKQKIKIVTALQHQNEYVAMTGDGVNDAPALKRATIGIAMGQKGTDVAREASDMVLTDDNFVTIVGAVREGRRIFDNIRKFIKYTMTSNSGEIWTLFLAPFLGLPLPLLPIQILWINLVTDGLPGLALSVEPEERGIMQRPPRPPQESIFAHGMWQSTLWVGLLIGSLSLGAMAWAYHAGSPNWQSIVFTVLTFAQLANALVIRSERESLFTLGLMSNLPLLGAVLFTIGLQMLVVYHPFFNTIFHTTPMTLQELMVCFSLPLVVVIAVEIEKWMVRKGWIYVQ
jgi:Ca2+-transporting ATPase